MPVPPLIRLGSSCCNHLLKKCSFNNNNLLRCKLSIVSSLAYTTATCSSSSDTNVSCYRIEKQKLVGKFKVSEGQISVLFARELKEFGFKHDLETYMSIVRLLLCDSGKNVRLNHLFMYLIDNRNNEVVGFEISDVLVRVYASVGRFDEAMHALSEMKSWGGLMVSTKACNFVLNELIEWDKVEKVASVYNQLKSNGLVPNVYTFEILMKGYCKIEYCRDFGLEEAQGVFTLMAQAGVEPNAFINGRYIHFLSSIRETNLAFHEIKILNQPAVDVYAYTCLIQGLVKEGKLIFAKYVLRYLMDSKKIVPNADCYGELIQGYYQNGYTYTALDLCKEMESRLGVKTEYVVMRVRMRYLCGVGRHKEALDAFREFMRSSSKEVYIDRVTFDLAIDAACQLGKMEDAVGLLEGMKKKKDRKMKHRGMHYRTLIDGYCLRGEPWNALYMFQEMMRNGLRPDSKTYYVLARGFRRCGVSLPLYMLFKL